MVRIPTAQELGAVPSIRAGAGIATIDNAGAIGNAAANVGQAVSQAAQIYQRDQEQLESFNTQAKWLETQSALDQTYQEAEANAPVDGKDFTRSTMESVGKGLDKALSEVPARLRPQYEVAAARARGSYQERAFKTEINQRERYYQDQAGRFGTNLLTDVQRDPDGHEKYLDGFGAYVDSTGLPPSKKAAMKEQAKPLFLKARIDGLIDKGRDADAEALRKDLEEAGGASPMAGNANPDYENPGAPRGIRTNNPGNIKDGAWAKSQPGYVGGDGVNAKFATPEAGVAAMGRLLDSYAKEGRNSVSSILSKWAPTSENDTGAYVQWVSNRLGVDPNAPLSAEKRSELVAAMAHYENGRPFPGTNTARVGDASVGDYISARIAQRDAAMRRQETQARVEQERQYKARVNQFELDILDGKAGLADVVQARQDGWLNDATDIAKLSTAIEKRDEEQNAVARVAEGGTFNPFFKEDRDAVGKAYRGMIRNGMQPIDALQAIYDKTGILPPDAVNGIRGAVVSSNPAAAMPALQVAASIMTKNPNAFTGYDGASEIEKNAVSFQHFVERGMPAEEATRRVVEMNTPEYKAKIKVGDKEEQAFLKGLTANTVRTAIGEGYSGWSLWGVMPWGGPPTQLGANFEQQKAIEKDFGEIALERYRETGDIETSKAWAAGKMKRNYGISSYKEGDRTFMKFPPEQAPGYPAAKDTNGVASHNYIYEQAAESVKRDLGVDVRPDKVKLAYIPNVTARDWNAGQPPHYAIWYEVEKDGVKTLEPAPRAFVADPAAAEAEWNRKLAEAEKTGRPIHKDRGFLGSIKHNLSIPSDPVNIFTGEPKERSNAIR